MEKPIRILLIEDNECDAALIIKHIENTKLLASFEIIETALQFDAALKNQQWDIVISDFSLPEFNALQALKIFLDSKIDIPFIVVSGNSGEETIVEVIKSGAQDYINKDNLTRLVPVIHRELAKVALRQEHNMTENRLQLQAYLLDLIGQSVVTVDKNKNITYWNKASEALYGWTVLEVTGRNLSDIMVHHNTQENSPEIMTEIKNGESCSRELIIVKRNGAFIPIHLTHTPILDDKGEVNGFIGISYEISESYKRNEDMKMKMEELATSNKELIRMNNLTIGREMRMIELKHHCNALSVRLGVKKPFPLAFLNETFDQKDY